MRPWFTCSIAVSIVMASTTVHVIRITLGLTRFLEPDISRIRPLSQPRIGMCPIVSSNQGNGVDTTSKGVTAKKIGTYPFDKVRPVQLFIGRAAKSE